jgi:hypothetical protein
MRGGEEEPDCGSACDPPSCTTESAVTDLDYGQGPGQSSRCFHVRQTETGSAGFIASSKNKPRKQAIVLSESDVY